MSTQSPLPQNDPLLIAFQKLTKTPEYKNAVNWTIKAENENHADGELWFAFAAGWNARNALAATPANPVREAATALVAKHIEVAEADVFEMNFGDGTMMIGMSPKDIYQIGYAAALFGLGRELTALKTALEEK